eukprot:scaffold194193_cov31-Tisochrysis_lutea.AAC.1
MDPEKHRHTVHKQRPTGASLKPPPPIEKASGLGLYIAAARGTGPVHKQVARTRPYPAGRTCAPRCGELVATR